MAKIISFATQKGGSGKSTLALVLAAPLATEYGLRIAVLDCDYQQSIVKTREQVDADNFEDLLKTVPDARYPYDVFALSLEQVFTFIDDPEKDYDLIIIDVPGRADGDDVFNVLTACDAVIVPLVSDYLDRASTAEFMGILEAIKKSADAHGIDFQYFGLSTKRVAGRREEKQMDDYIDNLGLSRFTAYLSHRVAYSRASTLYSLLNPAWLRYAGGNKETADEIRRLCEELIQRLGLPARKPATASLPTSSTSTAAN
ncbi:ParA family protein [Microvirga sp. STR05]|uniref:ParA family protein n=1 Tax=Hymenobacter duratus TaxID=2771356 RepID=A0ABR8JNH6_9BACT|nr:ParA family protein [Hymenobacter duratus]MBD2717281.1 ParA family protein [Hymenobacter duratus]MBR7952201.1 ParA family protein [Microvirga sp. STR05]